jgi:tetratricopeptide (TPR) repeat protein
LALDPNLASAHALIGAAKYFVGRGSETEAHIRETLRLSPRDTFAYAWMAVLGIAKLALGSDEEAVTLLQSAVEANPNYSVAHFWLASAVAHLGRFADARSAVQAGLALDPSFTVARFRTGALSDNPPIWLSGSGFTRVCARPGYRRVEHCSQMLARFLKKEHYCGAERNTRRRTY